AGSNGATHAERLAATLRAAATDEEAGELLKRGRLVSDLDPSGFDLAGGLALVPSPAGGEPSTDDAVADAEAAEAEATAAAEREAAERQARRERERAEARAAAAAEKAERLEREAERAEEVAKGAGVAAVAIGWIGWQRHRRQRLPLWATAAEAAGAFVLVWLAGPVAAAAVLFAVVVGQALTEGTQEVLVGGGLLVAALTGGLALAGTIDSGLVATAVVGLFLCGGACRLLATGVSRYEDGTAARYEALVQTAPTLIVMVGPDTTF